MEIRYLCAIQFHPPPPPAAALALQRQDLKIKHRDMDAGRLAECCNDRSRFRIGQVGERKEF